MESTTDITIFCTTYNHEKYIRQALDGFLMQKTEYTYEIVIHDDASTDGTQEIIREYQEKYPDIIRPIIQKENQYSLGKRRTFLRYASEYRGKYVALCEGDDYWTDPEKLQKQVGFMEENPEYIMTFHATEYLVHNQTEAGMQVESKPRYPMAASGEMTTEQAIIFCGGHAKWLSQVVRKEAFFNVPPFVYKSEAGDYPMQILYTLLGKVYYFHEIMGAYRFGHAGSWTIRMLSNNLRQLTHKNSEIQTLDAFNTYTEGKYDNAFRYAISSAIIESLYLMEKMKVSYLAQFRDNLTSMEQGPLLAKVIATYKKFFPEQA